ncbi:methyl-accepting chemotaxis protein [Neorhizobium alkalisoli]|uniref:methyl-accepting chemotaxis protein n=1 Tax=Neorhizobium alkalisoli TaxID=528178 RepID=UPI000CF8D387|nr:methyl-accepting chemotaxis protein [Neorhizobium alkalisoli]
MIRDRDRNELELQQMRVVVNALDSGLRRFAAGDLSTTLDTLFPAQWEGMRRDFNRGLNALNGTMDSVVGNARLLREESDTLRRAAKQAAETDTEHAHQLSKTVAAVGTLTQRLREQKTRAQHAAAIAQNAQLDIGRPREAVETALKLIAEMGEDQAGQIATERHEALSSATQQVGRELDALCLYLDALTDHLGTLSETAQGQVETGSSIYDDLNEIAKSRRSVSLKADMTTLTLDRVDRQIAEIDQKASRFARVTVIVEPPHDPDPHGSGPHGPGPRGLHLRLVKS